MLDWDSPQVLGNAGFSTFEFRTVIGQGAERRPLNHLVVHYGRCFGGCYQSLSYHEAEEPRYRRLIRRLLGSRTFGLRRGYAEYDGFRTGDLHQPFFQRVSLGRVETVEGNSHAQPCLRVNDDAVRVELRLAFANPDVDFGAHRERNKRIDETAAGSQICRAGRKTRP